MVEQFDCVDVLLTVNDIDAINTHRKVHNVTLVAK